MEQYKRFFVYTLIWGISFLIVGCGEKIEKTKRQGMEIIPVRAVKVGRETLREVLDYVGDIKAQDEAIIFPKVSGKIAEKIKEEGSIVNKGDPVAYIDRDEVGFKFEKAPIESPLTGIIGRFYVDRGTSVTPQTPIALVVDMDKVKIDLDVPEIHLPKIRLGQTAEISVQAYHDEKFIGEVSKISPVLDLETRTAPVEIIVHNPDHRLKSGMFVEVRLILEEYKDVLVITKEAILGKVPDEYVYIVTDNAAHLRRIKTGIHEGPNYEIIEGLGEGDLVVIMGQQRLYDGAQVSVELDER